MSGRRPPVTPKLRNTTLLTSRVGWNVVDPRAAAADEHVMRARLTCPAATLDRVVATVAHCAEGQVAFKTTRCAERGGKRTSTSDGTHSFGGVRSIGGSVYGLSGGSGVFDSSSGSGGSPSDAKIGRHNGVLVRRSGGGGGGGGVTGCCLRTAGTKRRDGVPCGSQRQPRALLAPPRGAR